MSKLSKGPKTASHLPHFPLWHIHIKTRPLYRFSPSALVATKRKLWHKKAVVCCSRDKRDTKSTGLVPGIPWSTQRDWEVRRSQSLFMRTNHSALPQEPMVIKIMLQVTTTRNSHLKWLASYLDHFCKTHILLEFCYLLLDLVKRLQVQKYIHSFPTTLRDMFLLHTDVGFSHILRPSCNYTTGIY